MEIKYMDIKKTLKRSLRRGKVKFKYRDKLDYIQLFNTPSTITSSNNITSSNTTNAINVKMINNNGSTKSNTNVTFFINQDIINLMKKYNCTRCTIPKYKLDTIL